MKSEKRFLSPYTYTHTVSSWATHILKMFIEYLGERKSLTKYCPLLESWWQFSNTRVQVIHTGRAVVCSTTWPRDDCTFNDPPNSKGERAQAGAVQHDAACRACPSGFVVLTAPRPQDRRGQLTTAEELWAALAWHWQLCHPPGPARIWQCSKKFSGECPLGIELFPCKDILLGWPKGRASLHGGELSCSAQRAMGKPIQAPSIAKPIQAPSIAAQRDVRFTSYTPLLTLSY